MTEHVVVAVDGGPASAAAFDWVVDRARTVEMRLEITTVVDINWFPQPNSDPVQAVVNRRRSEDVLDVDQDMSVDPNLDAQVSS